MKILFVTEFFPQGRDLKFSGGVEARTYFVAKYLAKNHQVDVIASRQKGSKKLDIINGIKIHRVGPVLNYSETASLPAIPNKIMFILSAIKTGIFLKPNIVDGANFIAHLIAKQISLKNKIPVVFWYPDVFIGQWTKNSKVVGIFGSLLERFNLSRSADHFIAISKLTLNKLVKNNVSGKKISQIYCGVDQNEFSSTVAKNKKFTVICVSRLVSYKRIDHLVKAFSQVSKKRRDIRLILIGSGPDENKLKQLCHNLKISNKVNFLKNLKRGDLIKQIKAAHLFCLPSSVEGFGIATIEAAAAGLPYIVSDIEIFKEVTKNGQGGLLFKLGDIEDLSKKLEKFIYDKIFYSQKSNDARKLSLFYDWSKIANQTEAVYKNLK